MSSFRQGDLMDIDTWFALVPHDRAAARAGFAQIYDRAQADGDASLSWAAAAGALLAINLDFVDFRGAALWQERFRAGLATQLPALWPLPGAAASVATLRGCAAAVVLPALGSALCTDDEPLPHAAQVLFEGLRIGPVIDPDERLLLTKALMDYHGLRMDAQSLLRLAVLQQDAMRTALPSVGGQARWWLLMLSVHEYLGDPDAARAARLKLQAVIDAHEVPHVQFALLTHEMPQALKAGQLGRAERIHRDIEALLPDTPAGFVPQGLRAQASYLAYRGDAAAALARIDRLLATCADLEVPQRDQGAYRGLRSSVLAALGRVDEALAELQRLRPHQRAAQGETLTVLEQFTQAAACIDREPDRARQWLAEALAGAVSLQFNRFFLTVPTLAARLCQMALDAGIEPEFVRATIRDRHLAAPDPTRADWPWRLKVRVLGELAVWRDDQPLRWSGKAQRKPLELLALLAAHGGGPVDAEALIEALWPSIEAEAPKASLEMAVSRLRKLLDLPDAVQVVDGAVLLDPAQVWCDAGAFRVLQQRLLMGLRVGGEGGAAVAGCEPLAERTLALYADRLLGSESLGGGLRLQREQLQMTFQSAVAAWGQALEGQGRWATAKALYEQALAREVLSEPLYRALMRAHLALGERAEAVRTFRRCADLLASVLGAAPAAETVALYSAARASH